jgi:hypothetical protein
MAIQDVPQFKSLSPEAQKIVMDKYNGLSPEARTLVDQKMGGGISKISGQPIIPLPEDVQNEKGLISEIPGLSPALVHGTTPLAEAVGETTQIPEAIRNPLSGTIGILPEIAGALSAPSFAKAVAPGVKAGVEAAGSVLGKLPGIKQAGEFLRTPSVAQATEAGQAARQPIIEALTRTEKAAAGLEPKYAQQSEELRSTLQEAGQPVQQNIQATQRKLSELKPRYSEKIKAAQELETQAKQGIGATEKKVGLAMEKIPEVPKDSTAFANRMKKIAGKPIEELTQMGAKQLQTLYKQGQILKRGNILPEEEALINQGMSQIDQARSALYPELGESLQTYRTAKDSVTSLPKEMAAEKDKLKVILTKYKQEADNIKKLESEGMKNLQTAKITEKASIMNRKTDAQAKLAELESKLKIDLEKAQRKADTIRSTVKAGLAGAAGIAGIKYGSHLLK